MSKTFLIVFHGEFVNGKIIDIGDDPCFDNPPTWGICRPTTRRAVKQKDILIFFAKVNNNYTLKGWFQVGEKLDYLTALNRFPNRKNVIISTVFTARPVKWRYRDLKKIYINNYGQTIPNFLLDMVTTSGTFYQSSTDDHETDNWKCRRILLCKSNQFKNCISKSKCLKNNVSITLSDYRNYIVADKDNWEDLDSLKISFDQIVQATGFPTSIHTPKGQHNVLRFDDYKEKFFNFINSRKLNLNNE